jgi:hypothetical protein
MNPCRLILAIIACLATLGFLAEAPPPLLSKRPVPASEKRWAEVLEVHKGFRIDGDQLLPL